MNLRSCIWIALVFSACRGPAPLRDLFPETVATVWHRTALKELPASESPDPVPRTAIDHLQIATYDGPGKLEARAYQLTSSAVALDMVQRWRPSADTVFFDRGEYLIVIKWQQAERKALQDFIRDLENRLKPKGS